MPAHPITTVGIDGAKFTINGQPTYPGRAFEGRPVEGLLFNVRAVQATFDDEAYPAVEHYDTEVARRSFAYPDTRRWDPERNVQEFCAAMPLWAAHGIRAVTVGFQGGRPILDAWKGWIEQPVVNTAFDPEGHLKPAYAERMQPALTAIDAAGMVAIVSYFYQGQDTRLHNEQAVRQATREATEFLLDTNLRNLIVDVVDESDSRSYGQQAMMPWRVHELIRQVQTTGRSGRRLLASTSFCGGTVPPQAVLECADFILIHGNNQSAAQHRDMAERIRALPEYQAWPRPIVYNEASPDVTCLDGAFAGYASWGYYDHGANNYHDGFQSPPVNWGINTPAKKAFFERVRKITGV